LRKCNEEKEEREMANHKKLFLSLNFSNSGFPLISDSAHPVSSAQ
jgi:hypothetical protein